MKLLVIGSKERTEKYLPTIPVVEQVDRIVVNRGTIDAEILEQAADADFIMADAISPVSRELISGMPNLKLIHSEGVAYNAIDLDAAREHGVAVCNNQGVNADAVAEQTILLMLACLRDLVNGDTAVRHGQQIQTKERMMVDGVQELGDCTIGFIGCGDIAQSTIKHLNGWGAEMIYYKRSPLSATEETELGATYADLDVLLAESDIVSIHVPVTDETQHMVNRDFISRMKPGSILINTARGEIVDQEALIEAIKSGQISRAGLDTLDPEPVTSDNTLVILPEEHANKFIFSPHIGGITEGMFHRAHLNVWQNIERIINGEEPKNRIA